MRSEDSYTACLERIRRAWDAGDAHAYAREFTDDATYVIFLGEPLIGRAAIERTHVAVLTRWQKGTKMAVEPISVHELGADIASVVTIGGIGKGAPIAFDKLQTYTFVRREGQWACAAFQNTEMSRRARRTYNPARGGLRALFGR
jgi:uncharacterized protein (TIGR02246 family)